MLVETHVPPPPHPPLTRAVTSLMDTCTENFFFHPHHKYENYEKRSHELWTPLFVSRFLLNHVDLSTKF